MRTSLAFLITLALSAPAAAQDKEPKEVTEVGGRSLSEWTRDINHKDPSKSGTAILAVMGFGPEKAYEAVPAMLVELRKYTPDNPLDTTVRVNLAISLGSILAAKKGPDQKLVKDAVTLLIRLLSDSQGIVKFRAAEALGKMGPEARTATTALLPLLRDLRSAEVRQTGALTLMMVAGDPKMGTPPYVITALQGLLTDKVYKVREAACQALGTLPPSPDAGQRSIVMKALEPLAKKDPEPTVQIAARMALMKNAGKVSSEHLESIALQLQRGDVATRIQAAQALGSIIPEAKEIVPALTDALGDVEPIVVGWVISALANTESDRAALALDRFAADPKRPDFLKKAAKDAAAVIRKKSSSGGK